MNGVSIRDAQKQDVEVLAQLIYTTEEHQESVWGHKSKSENLDTIKMLVNESESVYSLNYTHVIEYNSEVVGTLITIPYEKLRELNFETERLVLKSLKGIKSKLIFILENLKYAFVSECDKGDLYIANVATSDKVHGKGFGKVLMEYAESIARESNCKRCVLLAKDEQVAKFYENILYKQLINKTILGNRIIKMAKSII